MAFQKVEDGYSFWERLTVRFLQGQDLLETLLGFRGALRIEDLVDLLFEELGFGVFLGIIGAVEVFEYNPPPQQCPQEYCGS